jgi:hypothetical protein
MIKIKNTSGSNLTDADLNISGTGASLAQSVTISGTTITITLIEPYSWIASDASNIPLMYSGQMLRFTSIQTGVPQISVFQLPTDAAGVNTVTYQDARKARIIFASGGMYSSTSPTQLPSNHLFYINSGTNSSYGLILRFLIYN